MYFSLSLYMLFEGGKCQLFREDELSVRHCFRYGMNKRTCSLKFSVTITRIEGRKIIFKYYSNDQWKQRTVWIPDYIIKYAAYTCPTEADRELNSRSRHYDTVWSLRRMNNVNHAVSRVSTVWVVHYRKFIRPTSLYNIAPYTYLKPDCRWIDLISVPS